MVSAVSSINQNIPNLEDLEIIRRLQSLGLAPTGNKNYDKQRLQTAELQKKQVTLATNSEQNLNRLEGTGRDFSSMMNVIQSGQPTEITGNTQQNGLNTGSGFAVGARPEALAIENNKFQYSMIGANQLAELNKLKLGLIA